MAWNRKRVTNWTQLIRIFDSVPTGCPWDTGHVFRGQSNKRWDLIDSVARLMHPPTTSEADFINLEQIAFRHFVGRAHLFLDPASLPKDGALVVWWALMQHFGCPTRLLDWTGSPFVATYFACVDDPKCDGAVWTLNSAALLHGHGVTKAGIAVANRRLIAIKDHTELFWETGIPNLISMITPKIQHARLVAQQGLFSVCALPCDHGEVIDNSFIDPKHDFCHKIVIAKELKEEALHRLMRMNVTANSLFPGLDGLGRSTRDLLKLSTSHFGLAKFF